MVKLKDMHVGWKIRSSRFSKSAVRKFYESIAEEANRPQVSGLPKDWQSRILR